MTRYINADKLINKYEQAIDDDWNKRVAPSSWSEAYDCVIADIDDFPTADVQEVKHGKWIIHNERQDWQDPKSYMIFIECNKCGKSHFLGTNDCANSFKYEQLKRMGNIADYNYCGKCGTKMDKE